MYHYNELKKNIVLFLIIQVLGRKGLSRIQIY